MEGCNIMSLDISPSNQCLAFGDTSNSINLYASVADPVLNPYARDSEFADPIEQLPPMDINDPLAIYASVPRPHLPPGQSSYSSDLWPERFMRPGYRPTPDIDAEILKSMKVVGNIGYSRNINNMKRNMMRYANIKSRTDTTNNSRSNDKMSFQSVVSHLGTTTTTRTSAPPPPQYPTYHNMHHDHHYNHSYHYSGPPAPTNQGMYSSTYAQPMPICSLDLSGSTHPTASAHGAARCGQH